MSKLYTTKLFGNNVRFLTFFLMSIFFITSCEIENENDTDNRDNITGIWKCQEIDASNRTNSFEAQITKHNSDSTKIWIDNFSGLGTGVKVSVGMGGRVLTIPSQTVDGIAISGSGSISSSYNQIDLLYSMDDGGGKETFTAKFTR